MIEFLVYLIGSVQLILISFKVLDGKAWAWYYVLIPVELVALCFILLLLLALKRTVIDGKPFIQIGL